MYTSAGALVDVTGGAVVVVVEVAAVVTATRAGVGLGGTSGAGGGLPPSQDAASRTATKHNGNQILRLTLFFPFTKDPPSHAHEFILRLVHSCESGGFVYLRERGIAGPQHSAPPQPKAQTWK